MGFKPAEEFYQALGQKTLCKKGISVWWRDWVYWKMPEVVIFSFFFFSHFFSDNGNRMIFLKTIVNLSLCLFIINQLKKPSSVIPCVSRKKVLWSSPVGWIPFNDFAVGYGNREKWSVILVGIWSVFHQWIRLLGQRHTNQKHFRP